MALHRWYLLNDADDAHDEDRKKGGERERGTAIKMIYFYIIAG